MSMLSSRCDRLREIAEYLKSDPSTQHTAPEVRDAADIIWELRNKLADVVDQREEVERLKAENTKLRRLAKAAWGCVNRHVSCDECRMVCCGCTLQSAMRELGIEVE